ncbi:MAG TPA: methylated-DNA--[protein]-cysteine S-methyltransferase [Candidatus Limnocylindrales bacterium]|nr:methylated-DNA--[protein]-cysteine S-methyltransferase [Candidatus Limnocylindrales bacterium]
MNAPPPVMTLAGPWGPYHVAATDRGIVAAEWSMSREAFEASVARRLHGRPIDLAAARARLEAARPVLEGILAGRPVDASAVPLDVDDRPPFDQRVLLAVRDVPWGRTASYGEIARRVGAPRAARAVGGAVGRNPISLVIPCHRIIAADGTLGGYGGDGPAERQASLERKRELLLREGITVGFRAG